MESGRPPILTGSLTPRTTRSPYFPLQADHPLRAAELGLFFPNEQVWYKSIAQHSCVAYLLPLHKLSLTHPVSSNRRHPRDRQLTRSADDVLALQMYSSWLDTRDSDISCVRIFPVSSLYRSPTFRLFLRPSLSSPRLPSPLSAAAAATSTAPYVIPFPSSLPIPPRRASPGRSTAQRGKEGPSGQGLGRGESYGAVYEGVE